MCKIKCKATTKNGNGCRNYSRTKEGWCNIHARKIIDGFKDAKCCIIPNCRNSKLYSYEVCLTHENERESIRISEKYLKSLLDDSEFRRRDFLEYCYIFPLNHLENSDDMFLSEQMLNWMENKLDGYIYDDLMKNFINPYFKYVQNMIHVPIEETQINQLFYHQILKHYTNV